MRLLILNAISKSALGHSLAMPANNLNIADIFEKIVDILDILDIQGGNR